MQCKHLAVRKDFVSQTQSPVVLFGSDQKENPRMLVDFFTGFVNNLPLITPKTVLAAKQVYQKDAGNGGTFQSGGGKYTGKLSDVVYWLEQLTKHRGSLPQDVVQDFDAARKKMNEVEWSDALLQLVYKQYLSKRQAGVIQEGANFFICDIPVLVKEANSRKAETGCVERIADAEYVKSFCLSGWSTDLGLTLYEEYLCQHLNEKDTIAKDDFFLCNIPPLSGENTRAKCIVNLLEFKSWLAVFEAKVNYPSAVNNISKDSRIRYDRIKDEQNHKDRAAGQARIVDGDRQIPR